MSLHRDSIEPDFSYLLKLVEDELISHPMATEFSQMLRYQPRQNIEEITNTILKTDLNLKENCAELFYCRGRALYDLPKDKRPPSSEIYGDFNMSIELAGHIGGHLFAAAIAADEGRLEEAIDHLDAVLYKHFSLGLVNYYLALLHFKSRHFQSALSCLEKSVAFEPSNVIALFLLAYGQLLIGAYTAARERFFQAIRVDPIWVKECGMPMLQSKRMDDVFIAFFRGLALSFFQGQQDEAIACFKKILVATPSDVSRQLIEEAEIRQGVAGSLLYTECHVSPDQFYVELAQRFLQQGLYQDAEKSFELALEFAPNNLRAAVGMAALHLRAGATDAALEAAQQVLNQDPQHVAATILLGRIYLAQNKISDACSALQRAFILPGATPHETVYCHALRVKLLQENKKMFNGIRDTLLESEQAKLRHALYKIKKLDSAETKALQALSHAALKEVRVADEYLRDLLRVYMFSDIPDWIRPDIFTLLLDPRFWPAEESTYVKTYHSAQCMKELFRLLRKPVYPEGKHMMGIRHSLCVQLLCGLTCVGRMLCDERDGKEKLNTWAAYLNKVIEQEDLVTLSPYARKALQFELMKNHHFADWMEENYNRLYSMLGLAQLLPASKTAASSPHISFR